MGNSRIRYTLPYAISLAGRSLRGHVVSETEQEDLLAIESRENDHTLMFR